MKILLIDIETAPNTAYVWGLFDQNISGDQVIETSYVLCWSAKWFGEKKMIFDSVEHTKPKVMLARVHELLDQADVVVHYNGKKFDIPVLNKEFIKQGFTPPSPYKQIDLMQICKHQFRFESNKLAYITRALSLETKLAHEGFEMWVKCMKGDAKAWRKMGRYNRQDVKLLETLYLRLRPWITRHPNHGAFGDVECCPKCGSENFNQRGWAVTNVMKYRRYQCKDCGGWFRGNKSYSNNKKRERMANIV